MQFRHKTLCSAVISCKIKQMSYGANFMVPIFLVHPVNSSDLQWFKDYIRVTVLCGMRNPTTYTLRNYRCGMFGCLLAVGILGNYCKSSHALIQ